MIVFGHAVGRPRRVLTPVISQEDVPEEFRHPLLCEPGALSKRALR
jgi:hypothetical protein